MYKLSDYETLIKRFEPAAEYKRIFMKPDEAKSELPVYIVIDKHGNVQFKDIIDLSQTHYDGNTEIPLNTVPKYDYLMMPEDTKYVFLCSGTNSVYDIEKTPNGIVVYHANEIMKMSLSKLLIHIPMNDLTSVIIDDIDIQPHNRRGCIYPVIENVSYTFKNELQRYPLPMLSIAPLHQCFYNNSMVDPVIYGTRKRSIDILSRLVSGDRESSDNMIFASNALYRMIEYSHSHTSNYIRNKHKTYIVYTDNTNIPNLASILHVMFVEVKASENDDIPFITYKTEPFMTYVTPQLIEPLTNLVSVVYSATRGISVMGYFPVTGELDFKTVINRIENIDKYVVIQGLISPDFRQSSVTVDIREPEGKIMVYQPDYSGTDMESCNDRLIASLFNKDIRNNITGYVQLKIMHKEVTDEITAIRLKHELNPDAMFQRISPKICSVLMKYISVQMALNVVENIIKVKAGGETKCLK